MKHSLEVIQPVAIDLWRALKPFCSIIKVAGSIRRQQAECKDIEIVLLPIDKSHRNKIGLFFLNQGIQPKKGSFKGRYVKLFYQGFPVDIFIPQEHDYYRQLAIRTGSADYSARIARTWKEKGYVGTKAGLIQNCMQVEADPSLVQPETWSSEQDFFDWLGMEYLTPALRA
ncbi:MAG: hypothetical protein ACWA44_02545 [Thiotrichales bacterium]